MDCTWLTTNVILKDYAQILVIVRRYVFRMEDDPSDVFMIACPVCGTSVKNTTFTYYDNPWRKENDI